MTTSRLRVKDLDFERREIVIGKQNPTGILSPLSPPPPPALQRE